MLSTIREKTKGWIAGIILGLIAALFVLGGIGYYFEGGQPNVATVNGTPITVESYRQAVDEQRSALREMFGRNADPRLLDNPAVRERVLDRMIDEILLARDVESQGYRVSDAGLSGQIRAAPQFQRDGRFDSQLYEALLRNAGTDPRSFETRLRRDLLVRQSEVAFAASAFATDREVERLLRLQAQEREAAVAVLAPARLRNRVQVSAAEIEQEYRAHPERYQSTGRVRVQFLRLAVADLAREVRLDEAELRQALAEAAAESASAGEERRAAHILIGIDPPGDAAAEQAAIGRIRELRTRVQAGSDFARLAREHSQDPGSAARGGDLGVVGRGVFVKEFEEALYALQRPGELSEPVRTQFGVHLIRLTEIKRAPAQPAVDRARVEAALRARKAEERFFDMTERFHNLVYEQSDSLVPAAEALGLRIETSEWFTRAGGQGLFADPRIVAAAFDPEVLEQGRNSAVIEPEPNVMVAMRVAVHEPARLRPLEAVRAGIEESLTEAALAVEAGKVAAAALERLRNGAGLAAVAREHGLDLRPVGRYSRRTGGDAGLIEALFQAPRPAAGAPQYGSARMAGGEYALFALQRVIEPEQVALDGPEAAALRRAIESRRGAGHFDAYRAGLRREAGIKIFRDQL